MYFSQQAYLCTNTKNLVATVDLFEHKTLAKHKSPEDQETCISETIQQNTQTCNHYKMHITPLVDLAMITNSPLPCFGLKLYVN